MHPQYPHDNIRSLLRPGDSLVRREFEFLLSWDQSLFLPPGCYAKLPCSRHVEHIVRLIICELGGGPVRRCDHAAQQSQRIKGLFEHRRLSAGIAFMAGTGGTRSSETPTVHDRFLAATMKEQVTPAISQQRRSACLSAQLPADGVPPISRDEGQKVGDVCDANPGASEKASLAFQENCFSAFAGLLT